AHQAFGQRPLTPDEADRYVEQTAVAARLLGVVDPPTTVEGLGQVLDAYRPELESTAAAREAARFLLLEPPLPLIARPGYGTLASGGVSLLPPWARSMLGIPLPDPVSRCVARPLGLAGTAAVRWGLAGLSERRPSDPPDSAVAAG
ncbi:MAG TPA: oxygenase MpaB family protein, partial [Dermatophilaceae bacterium]|nr:oxygenase MpaB family protein [Dermatophilaceae bacterium]